MIMGETYINSEAPIKSALLKLFKKNDTLVIFDIGACEGEDSIRYSRIFPLAKIYSFEPVKNNIEKLKKNINKYQAKNITLIEKSVADQRGYQEIHLSSGQPEGAEPGKDYGNKSSSLLKPGEMTKKSFSWLKFDSKQNIESETIADFCEEHRISTIDFIHMDIQGAELMALAGAREKIRDIKAIWLEVSNFEFYQDQPLKKDVQKFMDEHGFKLMIDRLGQRTYGDQLYINVKYFSSFRIKLYRAIDLIPLIISRYTRGIIHKMHLNT